MRLKDIEDIIETIAATPNCDFPTALMIINNAPTITPESLVRHGRPIYHNRPAGYEHYEMVQQTESGEPLYKRQHYKLQDNPVAYCPECGKRLCSRFSNYCPNCGCKMELEGDSHG